MPFPGHRTCAETRSSHCNRHYRNRHKLGRTCSICGKPIMDANKSGLCKSCGMAEANKDPELRRRRADTLKRRSGAGGDLHGAKCAALALARAARDPEALRERGLKLATAFSANEPLRRARHAEAMRRKRHPWLPEEYRDLYKSMLRSGGYRAPEAKRIILEQVRADERRAANPMFGSRKLLAALLGMAR